MTPHDKYGRKIVPPSKDPTTQAVGRALCAVLGLTPDVVVRGVTGAMWVQWDYVALHQGAKFQDMLASAGYAVMPILAPADQT